MNIKGQGASPGIAIGKVIVLKSNHHVNSSDNRLFVEGKISGRSSSGDASDSGFERKNLALRPNGTFITSAEELQQKIDGEWTRLEKAISESKLEIIALRDRVQSQVGTDTAAIFDAHLLMLEDPDFLDTVRNKLQDEKVSIEAIYQQVGAQFATDMAKLQDAYLRERAQDIRDVVGRVLNHLSGKLSEEKYLAKLLEAQSDPVILVAHDLKPSTTAGMDLSKIQGFLIEVGSRSSHMAILARNFEIPAVVGLTGILDRCRDGDFMALDGSAGQVWMSPSASDLEVLVHMQDNIANEKAELRAQIGKETITKDGHKVELGANIGTPEDLKQVRKYDAEGVGLFRTEFLFLSKSKAPTEVEQRAAYQEVVEDVHIFTRGRGRTIIRTLDSGADKQISYLEIPAEENPALGYRAIRYCLEHLTFFRAQLRACLAASPAGHLGILFPMVQSREEIENLKNILSRVREEMKQDHFEFPNKIEIGIMIEVPSTIFILDDILDMLDFVSIGTNDLIQYLCAADRMNQKVAKLHDEYHPAVIRAIAMVIEKTHQHGKWAGMCGEMAAQPELIPLLLGLGLDEFSMPPMSILKARSVVRKCSFKDCQDLAKEVLTMKRSDQIRAKLKEFYNKISN